MSQNRGFQQDRRSLLGRGPSVNPWEGGVYPIAGHSGSTVTLATNLLSSVFTSPHQSSMQVPSSLSLDTRQRMGGSGYESSSDRCLPTRGSSHYSILNKLLNMRGSVYDSRLDRRLPIEGSDYGSSSDRHLHDSSLDRHLPIGGSDYDSSLDRRLCMGGSGYGSSLDRRLAVRGSGHNSVLNKLNMRVSGYDSSLNRRQPMEGSDNPALNQLLNMRGSDNNFRRYSEKSLYRSREMDVRRDPYYKDRRYASGRDIQEKKGGNQSFRSGNLEKGRSDRVTETDKKNGEEKKDEKADNKDAGQKTDEDCKRDSVNAEKQTEDEQEETKKMEEAGAKADKTDCKDEFGINNFTSSAERGNLSSVDITVNTGGQEEDEMKRNGTDKDISKEAGKEKENRTACKRYNVPDYNPNIAVGLSLLRQITGQVCRACHKFFLNAEDAKTHCRTLMHYNKFMEVVDEKAKAAEVKSKRPADKVDEDSKRPKVASLNEEDETGQSNEKRQETMEMTPNMIKKQKTKTRQFEVVRL